MRLALMLLLIPACAPAQHVWEKPIAPGLIYREEVDLVTPRLIHALRLSLKSPAVHAMPELYGHTVFEEGSITGRGPITELVEQSNALAGINGDFFSMAKAPSGYPLGLMVRQGELIAVPSQRVALAWGPQSAKIGFAKFSGKLQAEGGISVTIQKLNQKCPVNQVTLNTSTAGLAIVDEGCVSVTIKTGSAVWAPSTVVSGEVEAISGTAAQFAIPKDCVVLVANGTQADQLRGLAPGKKVAISLKTEGFDWEGIENAIGGGPVLLKDGKVSIDASAEGFNEAFASKRHPRSAAGITEDGDLWLVAVDGRQKVSDGATLEEMGKIMLKLGCVQAINLDGGGSTTLNVLGLTVNRPSDGRERAVASGIVLIGPKPIKTSATLKLASPAQANLGADAQLKVTANGKTVPQALVIWSAQGSAWIDQGGILHPIVSGPCTVSAMVAGQLLTAKLNVLPEAVKKKVRTKKSDD